MIPDAPPLLAEGFHAVPDGCLAAVVTALEMTARPTLLDRAAPNGLSLVDVPRPGLDWYRALFRRVGAEWLWTSRLTWSDEKLAATIHDPAVSIAAVVPMGRSIEDAVGYAELDHRAPGQCEVAFFGLAAGWTGKGVGAWLMSEALRRAWAPAAVTRVWIHTCTLDSPAALPFYLRMGFRAYRRQVEILPDPRLSGTLPDHVAAGQPVLPIAGYRTE